MSELIIETSNLSKTFGSKTIVSGLNISIEEGSIYGFLGANGAGKTTTMKMLLGLLKPSSGEIAILRKNLFVFKTEILRHVGSMIETPCAYPNLTAKENMRFVATMLNISKNRIDECLKIVNLNTDANKKVKEYSMGMKQRLGIAISLLHCPKLLILDEPTNGLDPIGIIEVREFIKQLPINLGVTVFISSHLLTEINLVATHVGIIHEGQLIFHDTLEKLKNENYKRYIIKVNDPFVIKNILKGCKIEDVIDVRDNTAKTLIEVNAEQDISLINSALVNNGIHVYELYPMQVTLEDIFMKYIKNSDNLNKN
jgi:lantibiotic transport system ATP-binding protein